MTRAERPSGCEELVVSRETRGPSFRLLSLFSCVALSGSLLAGCGYTPARSAGGPKLSVTSGRHALPELEAVQAALAGARSELGALDRLSDSSAHPRLVVEVFHVNERSSGIEAPQASEAPLARGSVLTLSGRAWVLDSGGAAPRADTGPVSVSEPFASGSSASADRDLRSGALRRAARRLGRVLARKALGLPAAGSGS